MFTTLIVPATYTFSIWGLIYLSWLLLWIQQAIWNIHISRQNSILLWSAQILSSLWLIPSQYLWIGTSLWVISWVLYLLLILFYESRNENVFFKSVSDLFLGWIIVAFIANFHQTLVFYDIYFFALELTFISILIGLAINLYFIIKYKSAVPSLVLIWALVGIIFWQEILITQIIAGISIFCVLGAIVSNYKALLK